MTKTVSADEVLDHTGHMRSAAQMWAAGYVPDQDEHGRQVGDDRFMHDWLHIHYQKYFPTIRCSCSDGECRPTKWRRDPKNGGVIQVLINRQMVSVDSALKIRDKRNLPADFPPELLRFSAHACAYGDPVTVSCVWIMDAEI